jgi:hypothetical protein
MAKRDTLKLPKKIAGVTDRAAMKGVAGAHPIHKNTANVRLPPKSSEAQ